MAGKIDGWIGAVDALIAKLEQRKEQRNQRIVNRTVGALQAGRGGGRDLSRGIADAAIDNAEDFHANKKDTNFQYQALSAVKYAMQKRNQTIDKIWKG